MKKFLAAAFLLFSQSAFSQEWPYNTPPAGGSSNNGAGNVSSITTNPWSKLYLNQNFI